MTIPGPGGPLWAVGLAAFALASVAVGELVRHGLSRFVTLFRGLDLVERALLDLYLGGAVFYVLASFPPGVFYPSVVDGVFVGAAVALVALAIGRWRRTPAAPGSGWRLPAVRPAHVIAFAAALGLFVVELAAIDGVATGNTYDSSLLSLYTGLLLSHHTLPISLAPVAAQTIAYPQGTTAWLGVAQLVFGLPPARTSLLVTPLFLAAVPLGAYSLGRRWVGTESAGVALALVFALAAAWTRGLVIGSNDFVFAAPLVLLLAGWSVAWLGTAPIPIRDALAFGALAGYAAALNPVGTEWLFLTLPVVALVARPRFAGRPVAWFTRWGTALLGAVVWILPSLYALGFTGAGGATGGADLPGISGAQWVSAVDPFLFRPTDQSLSPFPILRAELAILLVVGAWILLRRSGPHVDAAPFGRFLLAGGIVLAFLLGLGALAGSGVRSLTPLVALLSTNEEAILLFMLYTAVAAVPLVLLFEWMGSRAPTGEGPTRATHRRGHGGSVPAARAPLIAGALALALLLPGGVLTVGEVPGQLGGLYHRYSQVTTADFDLLTWSSSNLAPGAVVLVAPGSAAEFLPAYDPQLSILYPMSSGYRTVNASYWLVVTELTNGTWDAAASRALAILGAQFIAVTQANNDLFPPFAPGPLLGAGFPVVFHEDDAYVFSVPP
ncbi:MAG TPA: hypothetical protein VIZ68_00015 [Thermoplasmata archaeon]